MATNVIGSSDYNVANKTAWGAIFGGMFVFLAIMATFGALGAVIFAHVSNPGPGLTVWMTVLTIVSLYCSGRAAGYLGGVRDRALGVYHGLVTFGLSVLATILVLGLTLLTEVRPAGAGALAGTTWDLQSLASSGGWALFIALFVGFIGAMVGGAQAVPDSLKQRTPERPDVRRVA